MQVCKIHWVGEEIRYITVSGTEFYSLVEFDTQREFERDLRNHPEKYENGATYMLVAARPSVKITTTMVSEVKRV